MITIKNYVKAQSLAEAYELNQKRTNVVLGGMMWLKMSKRMVQNAIDLSDLNLDQIEEEQDQFRIGAMCSLRDLEVHPGLHESFGGVLRESVRHIVGVQFRNCATVGGTVYGRFGFSDVLTCLLVLDTEVELYHKGIVPLREFVEMPKDNDILVSIMIKKDNRKAVYQSFRRTKTDLPMLASAAAVAGDKLLVAIGGRPMKGQLVERDWTQVPAQKSEITKFAGEMAAEIPFGSNMRASDQYREHLAAVSIERAITKLREEVSC